MSDRPVVILMTSNGVGMGHLSRQLTVALSGAHRFDAVILTLSRALPRVIEAAHSGELPDATDRGVRFEYAPSWESGWLPTGWRAPLRRKYRSYRWAPYLRDRIRALAVETGAQALVFDGVAPYPGLIGARQQLPELKFAWLRRGLWRRGAPAARLDLSRYFDLTIEPGDVASQWDRGPTRGRTDVERLPGAVSLTDVLSPYSREEARRRLHLPADRPILLLTPGSGALASVDATAAEVLAAVRAAHPDWLVAVTRQSIARHSIQEDAGRVIVLDDVFPLVRYLSAFDAAVGVGGYNGVHELLSAGIPTLLIPSLHHATDDQPARTGGAARRGAALTVQSSIASAIDRLLTPAVQDELRAVMRTLEPASAGLLIADRVAELAGAGTPATTWPNVTPYAPLPDLRTQARRGTPTEVRWTHQLDRAMLEDVRPVEHVLPGTSQRYAAERRQIANWLYRTR
ncbi:MAG TPA: hypothetical protein H9815_13000 [Candidatus Ruania gallistercoris]|uniref:UDP-N-acetylglucosamine--LPS N-acetylglucosamine transferase n=1 Tax=Candidatus Ruania gallistercoris TaxID=2838746 RepID=A0A9D2EFH5_9MICO|nr:hypothetical protein [Candidatus Ruania gallistercoris]